MTDSSRIKGTKKQPHMKGVFLMKLKRLCRLFVLSAGAVFLLSACSLIGKKQDAKGESLTWGTRVGYMDFLDLAEEKYPDIQLEYDAYAGANPTAYSWAQMRGDDIPDIFITSRVLDKELAKERLADLSDYDFVDGISDVFPDQCTVDGGVYLLPVNNTMYGIYYNKTLMEEKGWEVPTDFAGLEDLCAQIRDAGMTPGLVGTALADNPFLAVFNLAKTDWFSTPAGAEWEQEFLAGNATAAGTWEHTMEYVQRYIDIGMFSTDPQDRGNKELIEEELGNRRAMFCTTLLDVTNTELPNGDELGMMPYISEDGSKNGYIYYPGAYIGISSRLTRPGNEKKLEDALKLLSLLYSPEGQASFITERTPCALSVLDEADVSEDALVYGAWQAQCEGKVFPVTYTHWEQVLTDMGLVFKEWFCGREGMDGPACIALMDELQTGYLSRAETVNYSVATSDFTLEETAELAGKALGSRVGADAAMIPIASFYKKGNLLNAGISGKLYKGMIDAEGLTAISPSYDGEYAILTMTGAQAEELAKEGFDIAGDEEPYPYVLVTKGGELEEGRTDRGGFLMESYTHETGELYKARIENGSFRTFLREWLEEQQSVSPDGNPWE